MTKAELLTRKMAAKSKHELAAKIELQKKMERLQNGEIPKEVQDVIKKEKKYTSNAAFIKDKTLKAEYENRSYASDAYRQLD
jgi:D-alanine-D-alanine ligase-like ATP-grasp enzyme